jgi:Protein of unknown function (DUF3987)
VPSRDVYNKGHSAADMVIDRKSGGTAIVYDPAIKIVIATQPRMLRDLWSKPGVEGRGVLARPLYSFPAPVFARGRTPEAPKHVLEEYERRIVSLYEDTPSLQSDEDGRPQPATLRFGQQAETVFEAYELELATKRAEIGASEEAEDEAGYLGWLSKLAGQTARLAAILHVAAYWTTGSGAASTTIDADTVHRAIRLARHYHDHALAAFGLMGEMPTQKLARRLLNWIEREQRKGFTTREAHRTVNARGRSVKEVRAALVLLEEHGYIRRFDTAQGAGRHSEVWETHPDLGTPESKKTTDKTDKKARSVSSVSEPPKNRDPHEGDAEDSETSTYGSWGQVSEALEDSERPSDETSWEGVQGTTEPPWLEAPFPPPARTTADVVEEGERPGWPAESDRRPEAPKDSETSRREPARRDQTRGYCEACRAVKPHTLRAGLAYCAAGHRPVPEAELRFDPPDEANTS